jgi:hypothetical protein
MRALCDGGVRAQRSCVLAMVAWDEQAMRTMRRHMLMCM